MTTAATEVSTTNARDFDSKFPLPNIDENRQHKKVSRVGKKALEGSNAQPAKSVMGKIGQWFKSRLPNLGSPTRDESIASSSSDNNDGDLAVDDAMSAGPVPAAPIVQPPLEKAADEVAHPLNSDKKPSTHQRTFELFATGTANFDNQLRAKALYQERQMQSQQTLQRALNAIADMPETGLTKNQTNRAEELIQTVRQQGVEWSEGVWSDKRAKQNLEEEIRLLIDEKQTNHPLLTNQYMQKSQTKTEFVQMCLGLVKSLHENAISAARAIGR